MLAFLRIVRQQQAESRWIDRFRTGNLDYLGLKRSRFLWFVFSHIVLRRGGEGLALLLFDDLGFDDVFLRVFGIIASGFALLLCRLGIQTLSQGL